MGSRCGKAKCAEPDCTVKMKKCEMIDGRCPACDRKNRVKQELQQQQNIQINVPYQSPNYN